MLSAATMIRNLRRLAVMQLIVTAATAAVYVVQSVIFSRQLALSQDQEKRQLRSYVGVDGFNVEKFPNIVRYVLTLKDYGSTPAYNVVLTKAEMMAVTNQEREYTYNENLEKNDPIATNIYPQNGLTHYIPSQYAFSDFEKNKSLVSVVHGRVNYVDAFYIRHFHKFCYYFDFDAVSLSSEGHPYMGYQCSSGNDDDDVPMR